MLASSQRLRTVTTDPNEGFAYLSGLTGVGPERGRPTLSRMRLLTAALGDPQQEYPSIHVTGTNGKGSTAAMTEALLRACGLKVGLYTSPHIDRVRERVVVDGRPVEAAELGRALIRVRHAAQQLDLVPTWFEAMTAAGLSVLAQRRVDVAVVEVGVLGRWDSTNVIDGRIAVITTVDLDHLDRAGPTREHVMAEKAGIIRPGATVILGPLGSNLRAIANERAPGRVLAYGRDLFVRRRVPLGEGSRVDLHTARGPRLGVRVGAAGPHQCDNAVIALSAAEEFLETTIETAVVDAALTGTHIPGRVEILDKAPLVVADGAHNAAAARALLATVREMVLPGTPTALVVGMRTGRDPGEFLDAVGARAAALVVATTPAGPDAEPPAAIEAAARARGVAIRTAADPADALQVAAACVGVTGLVLGTGSFGMIEPLRRAVGRCSSPS